LRSACSIASTSRIRFGSFAMMIIEGECQNSNAA
jgi:hypothetical protein